VAQNHRPGVLHTHTQKGKHTTHSVGHHNTSFLRWSTMKSTTFLFVGSRNANLQNGSWISTNLSYRTYEGVWKDCSFEVQLPSFLQRLRRFAVSLLKVDCSTRYEVLKNDTKYIKCHEWFKNLVWESIIVRKTKLLLHCVRWRTQQTLIYMKA